MTNSLTSNINPTQVRAMIIDMDGVLWRGSEPIGDLAAIFDEFKHKKIKTVLATNNPTRTVAQYLEKLSRFGVSLEPDQVITSALATAEFLQNKHPLGGPIYIIGEEGLHHALSEKKFFQSEEYALAVVVSLDRELTYKKLLRATLLIRSEVPFIVTNPDRTLPVPEGLAPGAGSITAALRAATDVEPIIIGKPQPEMYKIALIRMKTTPGETIVVGDRLETDIAGGQALGCKTCLVLSGVTDKAAVISWSPRPDYVEHELTNLVDKL